VNLAVHRFDQGRPRDLVKRDLAVEAADLDIALDVLDVHAAAEGVLYGERRGAGRCDRESGTGCRSGIGIVASQLDGDDVVLSVAMYVVSASSRRSPSEFFACACCLFLMFETIVTAWVSAPVTVTSPHITRIRILPGLVGSLN